MSDATYHIGDAVTFTHAGTTMEGRVVGTEDVDDWRRRTGLHFHILTACYERFDVHETQVGSLVGAEPCVTSIA